MSVETEGDSLKMAPIEVRACKYDGRLHRRWMADFVETKDSLIILRGAFTREIRHRLLGVVEKGTISTEYYWTDRWYSIFQFVSPSGALRNYYCNVNLPPTFAHPVLSYVDLDIDVLVAPDLSYQILDEDEFAANALRFNYSAEVCHQAKLAVAQLVALIKERRFPFTEENDE